MNPGYILVVDDEPDICRLMQEILEDEHYQVKTVENAAAAREAVRKQRPDLVLLDIWMPGTDGISLLREWSENGGLEMPVIMISGHGTVETAVEATRLGAYDFIEKPVSMGKLLVTIERALETDKLRRENLRLRRQAEPTANLTGKSPVMQELRENIERIAATDAWVLITGEPGSGKEVAARYLHAHSPRQNGPFVEVSLSAVSSAQVAAQLFGQEQKGVITAGCFEQAAGGTLLLNEIGGLDLTEQARVLDALEKKRYARVGGSELLSLDARILSASDQDLLKAVEERRFREDLYYRLNVVPLRVPSLREHHEDVPELISFYVNWMADNEHLPYRKFTTGALNVLRNYSWPGNVSELRNVVQRLLILHRGEEVTEAEVEQTLGSPAPVSSESYPPTLLERPLREAREQFEKAYLEHQLKRTGGNVAEVARLSGMERTHLYRKLKQLGVNPKPPRE
ncbi:MAG: sigma-54 dependent transcriptional regulator [Gammaproteobacteria bacterium]|nr:sigma-54 dependent transcriptional regulator [Gammaproteobacteria bacterium]MDH5511702.1 sigma-54 dependent transcriptional regulator [Gammaproteobacteria bacterium]